MMVTRSRNTRDPIPVSSSLPGGLVTMEEMFQMVTTNNASVTCQNMFRCFLTLSGSLEMLIFVCLFVWLSKAISIVIFLAEIFSIKSI